MLYQLHIPYIVTLNVILILRLVILHLNILKMKELFQDQNQY
jgi:hypothetical protein